MASRRTKLARPPAPRSHRRAARLPRYLTVGTIVAVVGGSGLALLGDSGFDEWRFVAAVMVISGLLLRIEAAVRTRGRL